MSKIIVFVCSILLLLQQHGIKGNPFSTYQLPGNLISSQNIRTFDPQFRDWFRFRNSWSLPSFPFFSVSSLVRDEDDDTIALKKRVGDLEERLKEVFETLDELTKASKTSSRDDEFGSSKSPSNEQSGTVSENTGHEKAKPGSSNIANGTEEDDVESAEENQAQSVSTPGDDTTPYVTSTDEDSEPPTKGDEGTELPAPTEHDNASGDARENGNEEKKTIEEESEKAESSDKLGNIGNSQATEEPLAKSQVDQTAESHYSEKLGSSENGQTEHGDAQTVDYIDEETDVKLSNDFQETTSASDSNIGIAAIAGFVLPSNNNDTNANEN